jgi:hypothetical protein
MSQVIIYKAQVIAAMNHFEAHGASKDMTTLAAVLGLMEYKARDNLVAEVNDPACQLMRSIGQELAVLDPKFAVAPTDAGGCIKDYEQIAIDDSHLRYCDRNIQACELKNDTENLDWWRKWKAELQRRIAARSPVLDPSVVPAHKRGYRVTEIVDARTGAPGVFAVSKPSEAEIGPASTFEKAWAMAMRDYLETCIPVERGDELDIGQALDDDNGFFVLKNVEVPNDSKLHDLTGWRIDVSGLKDRTMRGPADGSPVKLSTGGLRAITPDEVELLWQCPLHMFVSGKGAVNFSVVNAEGIVLREISMKARLDSAKRRISWVDMSAPFLVKSIEPHSQPARYNHVCFIDDGGVVLDVDPATKLVSEQVRADTEAVEHSDAPTAG